MGRWYVAGAGVVLAAAATACGSSTRATPSSTTTAAAPPVVRVRRPRQVVPDPGRLPQTDARPTVGRRFDRRMHVVWQAIVRGSPDLARPVFFPESAYRQVKAIWNPDGDFRTRIWAIFRRDLVLYHRGLGGHPTMARLVSVDAAPGAAGWVPAGLCENGVGYWHLPGTRLVYITGRTRASFGIWSMISWRGVWYVIHLGPNWSLSSTGSVDDPQIGSGTPGIGPGC
jgi:hypothetical protein